MKKIGKIKAAAVFSVLCVLLCGIGALDKSVPNDISAFSYSDISVPSYVKIDAEQTDNGEEKTVNVLGVPFKRVKVNIYKDVRLIPGGEAFGVKLHTRGVMVVGKRTRACEGSGYRRKRYDTERRRQRSEFVGRSYENDRRKRRS